MSDLFPLSDILRSSATKSGETDDAEVTKNIYVVNYADDGGFAILAADTLMETILAYSDQGNITDTMDNPGVRTGSSRGGRHTECPAAGVAPVQRRVRSRSVWCISRNNDKSGTL